MVVTQPEQILAALEAAGGELTYPGLIAAITGPEGLVYPLERMARDGKIDAIDAGHPDRRPWVWHSWCDCELIECAHCNQGPLVLRLRDRGGRIARNLLRSSYT